MIAQIRDNSFLKRSFILLIAGIFILVIMNFISNYLLINKLYRQHINTSRQLVGIFASNHPMDEKKIVDIVMRNNGKNGVEYGKKVLEKYGYDNQFTKTKDASFKGILNFSFVTNCFLLLLTLSIFLFIFFSSYLHIITKLNTISSNISALINGQAIILSPNQEEGLLSKINTQFYHMSRILQTNLEKLNLEKENIKGLITDISHQLKTPLSSIKMYNTMLIEETDISEAERNEFLQTSKEEINKLHWLVAALVKLSRLEAGMIELKTSSNPLNNTIISVVEAMEGHALSKELTISLVLDKNYNVNQDERWTKEAISNVIENAIKYSKRNSTIEVKTVNTGLYVRLDITDKGIGIPEKDFNNIFKRFFRGDLKEVKMAEGSGVGLYLTRKILENQGGSIAVDSILGRGTTFSLFFQKSK